MRVAASLLTVIGLTTVLVAQQPTRPPAPSPRAPGGPGPMGRGAAQREAPVPFAPGETLTFDVSWAQMLTAGTAVMHVVEKKPSYNSTAYYISVDGRPLPLVARFYPVYYKMDTLLDSFTSLSQWTSLYQEENSRKRQTSMRFDRGARQIHYEMTTAPAGKADIAAPPNVQDGLAALYALRSHNFRAGERFTVPIADDGSLYTVQFDTAGREAVSVKAGQFDAWSLKVAITDADRQVVGNNLAVWISSDARRLPVKMQAELSVGTFVLDLREAH